MDVAANRIETPDGWIQVKPRSMAVLQYLVGHAGEVCSRQDIMDRVWARVEVSEEVLNHAVHELRGAFEDDPRHPEIIETIPRGGYRLIASVEEFPQSGWRRKMRWLLPAMVVVVLASSGIWWLVDGDRAADMPVRKLAVLPFESMGPDTSFDYFSDGLTEELITELNRINPARLDVIARTSVMAFKGQRRPLSEIAGMLGVDYVVEGSVRRDADRIRITAQLIETEGETHLWAESFDRRLENILELQHEIAQSIARQARVPLDPEVRPRRHSVDPEAYRDFLRGRAQTYQFHRSGYAAALESFEAALERQSDYAVVHGWKAAALSGLAFSRPSAEERTAYARRALQSARRALELDPELGIAHFARGWLAFSQEWAFARAERLFREALEVDPNSWWIHFGYAELLSALGRHEEAIAHMETAYELDPVNPFVNVELAAVHAHAGRYREGLEVIDRALEALPHHQELHDRRSNFFEALGRFEKAIEAREKYAAIQDREYDADGHRRALAEQGERGYWRWLLDSPDWYSDVVLRAKLLALLGRHDSALDLIAEAVEQRKPSAVYIGVYRQFEPLSGNARFDALLEQAGLSN
ncbi:hypothetical protein DZK25_12990 [Wenzhouxiangella sp. 15181]|nr:hypothetical protein DZK25_12990 [Wenzhouxiangella sp. 15181]RFP67421.1 hypothetical protein DZK26_13440 [Wenzhouxiangella sp. 15190]